MAGAQADGAPSVGESFNLPSAPNLRDLGGWPAGAVQVRRGVLYRSAALNRLNAADQATFSSMGIRTVFDLRTADERSAQPDQLPAGVSAIVVDVLADSPDAAPAALVKILSDPTAAEELLGGDKTRTLFAHTYRELVSLPSARAGFSRMFTGLLDAETRPALFHCTTGKDRTGWAAAALLLLLGVDEDLVIQEYLLTNTLLLPALQPVFDRFSAAGGDPALLHPVLGVDASYLQASLDEMRVQFGTVETYFADGLGIDAASQAALRRIMLDTDRR
jgi:protein-tyrosine phosphatase